MAAPDNTSRNAFRKGAYRKNAIHEDPTYLSFMFLFHQFDHSDVGHSPLLDGTAEKYLTQVVRSDVGEAYAKNLKNFTRVLTKVNREMPWFWQGLKGVEAALNYGDMKEPWRGSEKPVLEIECLEENVELTAIGLMDLYKRSCFDFERYVEVVPRNLREFSFDLYISEIRDFQSDTDARNLGIVDNPDSRLRSREVGQDAVELHAPWSSDIVGDSPDSRPFIALRFTHCEFDINSIADYFADLSRNPEAKRPTIKIQWGTCTQISQKLGPNMFNEDKATPQKTSQQLKSPADPAQRINEIVDKKPVTLKDVLKDTLGSIKDDIVDAGQGVLAQVQNAADGFNLQPNGIGNVHGNQLGGLGGRLLDQAKDNVTARLLLDNVHGAGGLSSIQDAINGGLINAVSNSITGGLAGGPNNQGGPSGGGGINDNIHPMAIDSTPDGDISPKKVYDEIAPDRDDPINDNVHE